MRAHLSSWAVAVLLFFVNGAVAQDQAYTPLGETLRAPLPSETILLTAQGKDEKDPKGKDEKEPKAKDEPPATDAFAQAPTAGGDAPSGLNPRMIGDFQGYFGLRTIFVPSIQTTQQFTPQRIEIPGNNVPPRIVINQVPGAITQTPVLVPVVTRVLLPGHGPFKVAENQSPMPEDRVSFAYNFFNGIRGPESGVSAARVDTQSALVNGALVGTATVIPSGSPTRVDLHTQTFGFEKTFLDGNASVGVRLPIFQMQGDGSMSQNDFGDISFLLNYAFYLDRATGNVVSGGMVLTAPTGPSFETLAGDFHSTLLQPFGGFRWSLGRAYFQGFSSLVIPTDSRDITTFFNDVGIGYWLSRGSPGELLPAIIPTVEAHVATPLNHRAPTDPMFMPDIVNLTAGVHLGLTNRSMLTLGVCTPVTGPRLFDVEGVLQFNFRF